MADFAILFSRMGLPKVQQCNGGSFFELTNEQHPRISAEFMYLEKNQLYGSYMLIACGHEEKTVAV